MSNLTRSAKVGACWTAVDLLVFNIQVTSEDAQSFFGAAELPTPSHVPSTIWDSVERPHGGFSTEFEASFFVHMEEVESCPDEVAAVHTFVTCLLRNLRFEVKRRMLHTGTNIPFIMCGTKVSAKPDVVMIDHPGMSIKTDGVMIEHSGISFRTDAVIIDRLQKYLLLVQEVELNSKNQNAEPQLIAAAIAAFSKNNLYREEDGLSCLESQRFLGIILVGTAPEFYKIVITQELVSSVATGQYPSQPTVVKKLLPPDSDLTRYRSQGMRSLENRRYALKCFEAFKEILAGGV